MKQAQSQNTTSHALNNIYKCNNVMILVLLNMMAYGGVVNVMNWIMLKGFGVIME